ncbi:hypothetical protein [Blastococcus deserti]|uniref:Uncharacterized protein n=1 Tax=Blastococcus deserti TaxID=2259033 RepID=A0ABW4X7G0_9ACTN
MAATLPVIGWRTVLGAVCGALAITAMVAVLPPGADGVFPMFGVLLLAAGSAVAADDPTAPMSATVPVATRRQLLARVLLVVPVAAAALGAVMAMAAVLGVALDRSLVVLWATLTAVALAAGAAAGRAAGVPGPVAAVIALGAGLVIARVLPAPVRERAPWDSAIERGVWALALSLAVLWWSTRDPAS